MNRRNFVLNSSLTGVAIITGTSALTASNVLGANDKVNIGIIGTGDRGSGLIPFLNDIDGIEVIACCDILAFRLEKALSQTRIKAKGYSNYKDLLSNKDIDAVLIATPFSTHAQIALDALDAGKHVYCEKTMVKGLKPIHTLIKKVDQSNKIFQTGHQYHSSRLYNEVVNMIKGGEIGAISLFECQWNRNGNWRRPVSNPSLERQINWRMYKEFSGGLTAELSSHQIDFVHWVLGENPKDIRGVGGIDFWKDGRETFDNTHLIYNYPSGVKATFTCLTNNALGDYQIKVHGSKGTILLDYQKAWLYYEKGVKLKKLGNVDGVSGATANPQEQGKGVEIKVSHLDPSKQALVDFRNSIINNTIPISNVRTGGNTAKAVQLSLNAMYQNNIQNWQ